MAATATTATATATTPTTAARPLTVDEILGDLRKNLIVVAFELGNKVNIWTIK
jgi:uncharacterized protein YhdP